MGAYRVLVAEDEVDHFELVRQALNVINITDIVHAKDGVEASKHLQESMSLFNLIISDINMPNMSGLQFLEVVRKNRHYHDVPFIMITGEGTGAAAIASKERGATSYIPKPISLEKLTEKVRTALALGHQE